MLSITWKMASSFIQSVSKKSADYPLIAVAAGTIAAALVIKKACHLYRQWEKNQMQSSARVNAALKSSLTKARRTIHVKKFEIETVTHTKSVPEIFDLLKNNNDYSDHLPVMHREAVTATWNMLKQCSVEFDETGKVVIKTNNGFNRSEHIAEYQARLRSNLNEIGRLAASHNANATNIPVSVLCLQEITSNALSPQEIDKQLSAHGFTTQCSPEPNENHLIQECTEKKDEILVMAYDYKKVAYIEPCVIPSDILSATQTKESRFQAAKFMDKTTKQEFVVVNVHQNWDAVNITHLPEIEPSSNHDVMHIVEHFQKLGMPCIITGDFNTTNIPLPPEDGKIVIGNNANMCWNFKTKAHQLDACDHIVMNEKYYREFLPALKQKLHAQKEAEKYEPSPLLPRSSPASQHDLPESSSKTYHIARL